MDNLIKIGKEKTLKTQTIISEQKRITSSYTDIVLTFNELTEIIGMTQYSYVNMSSSGVAYPVLGEEDSDSLVFNGNTLTLKIRASSSASFYCKFEVTAIGY